MSKKSNVQPKITDDEVRRLVIERLSTLSPNKSISVGSDGSYTKNQLVQEIKNGSKIGEKMIEIEVEFLQSLKDLPTYGPKIASNN